MDVLCASCNIVLNANKCKDELYAITKCGHVYHRKCLENMIIMICKKCHVPYNPYQCHKLYLYSDQAQTPEYDDESIDHFEWIYCDGKTDFGPGDFNEFALKLGTDLYAARAFHKNAILPAYYSPTRKVAIVNTDGKTFEIKEDIEILLLSTEMERSKFVWTEAKFGEIPDDAFNVAEISKKSLKIEDGKIDEDEKLYFVCAKIGNHIRYGKLCSKNNENRAYLQREDKEVEIGANCSHYKILVRRHT